MKKKNPAVSGKQYRMMQAARHGSSYASTIPKKIAEKFIKATPKKLRSEWRSKRNPETSVEELAKGFHGRDPLDIVDIVEEAYYNKDQAVIGLLEEIELVADEKGSHLITINFAHDDRRSAFSHGGSKETTVYVTFPNRHQIEFIGGDQSLPYKDMHTLVTVAPVYGVTYWTDKHHLEDSTGFSSYEHRFGEEVVRFKNSEKPTPSEVKERVPYMPLLVYDTVNKKCLLVGGSYTVENEGITN